MPDDKKVQSLWRPFVVGARSTQRVGCTRTVTLGSSSQRIQPYYIDTIGFVGSLYIYVDVAGSNGGGSTVALQEDAPWSVFSSLTLYDTGSKPIGGTMTGSDWYEFIKHGGFTINDDERRNVGSSYTALTTGTGATAGTGSFCLRIPVGINKRNALGALVNKNAGSTLRLEWDAAALSAIYSTAPSAGATVTITVVVDGWLDAASVDTRGNPVHQEPPGGDTTMFVSKQSYAIAAGAFTQRLDSIDGPIRSLVNIFRRSSSTRQNGDSDWPALTTIRYENLDPWVLPKTHWRRMIAEWFDLTAAVETAKGRSYGVYPLSFFDDFGLQAGVENGFKYLPVSSQVAMSIGGTFGNAGTLDVLVNKVYPGNNDPLTITGGR